MSNFTINIKGCVQGVGFRPMAYRLAADFKLNGEVYNLDTEVCINLETSKNLATAFLKTILNQAPPRSRIDSYSIVETELKHFSNFSIVPSQVTGNIEPNFTSDIAICDDCISDLNNPNSKRFNYPFTHCAVCGPRYSILTALPYDRNNTSMKAFKMCPNCIKEYNSPVDRRFHAQINSCPNCGIEMQLTDSRNKIIENDYSACIAKTAEALNNGKIIAIKGIGGYLLLCDAQNKNVIHNLRVSKHRPHKPLAVMFPNLEAIKQYALVNEKVAEVLLSPERPIVVLPLKHNRQLAETIHPDLDQIGVFLPYAPVLQIIAKQINRPLIATSGNIHGNLIEYQNKLAQNHLSNIADYFLHHSRKITIPSDDSVVKIRDNGSTMLLRRARGYAPSHCPVLPPFNQDLIAFGADLKSSFSIFTKQQVYISQYFGNLENLSVQDGYKYTLDAANNLLKPKHPIVLCDMHPSYNSNHMAQQFAKENSLKIVKVPHHEAHAAAIIAEHQLQTTNKPLLVLAWDGIGYGSQGNLLGSECYTYTSGELLQFNRLPEYKIVGGDQISKNPMLALMCIAKQNKRVLKYCNEQMTPLTFSIYQQLLKTSETASSSMGRLFDAVAAILGWHEHNSYEGRAAMWIETLATRDFQTGLETNPYQILDGGRFDTEILFNDILDDIQNDIPKETVALRFHMTLASWIMQMATMNQAYGICLSGGTFQNSLLSTLIHMQTEPHFKIFEHEKIAPNDENICYGQMAWYIMKHHMKKEKPSHQIQNKIISCA